MNYDTLPDYHEFVAYHGTGWCRMHDFVDRVYVYYCTDGEWQFTVFQNPEGNYIIVSDDDPAPLGTKIEGTEGLTLEQICHLAHTLWRMR